MTLDSDALDDTTDLSKMDRGDSAGDEVAVAPPAVTPPADTPPADTPPAETPPAATPPVVTPPAETPPAATPPVDGEPPKRVMIPKERFDEVNERRKKGEAEIERIRTEHAAELARINEELKKARGEDTRKPEETPGTPEWFDGQERLYMQTILDGKEEDAIKLRREIRAEEVRVRDEAVNRRSTAALSEQELTKEWDGVVTELEGVFPELSATSDKYDDVMVKAILGAQNALMAKDRTLTPAKALAQAAARFGYDPTKVGEAAASVVTPPAAAPTAPAPAAPAPAAPRPSNNAPPRGGSDTSVPVSKVGSEEEILSLSERDRAKLRGDFVD